jgi:hypothetical protein
VAHQCSRNIFAPSLEPHEICHVPVVMTLFYLLLLSTAIFEYDRATHNAIPTNNNYPTVMRTYSRLRRY